MAELAKQIMDSKQALHVSDMSAALIEEDVIRKVAALKDGPAPDELDAGFATIEGGRRYVEIVEITDAASGEPFAMYGVKNAQGSEPQSAVRASELCLGPKVLLVSDDHVILEEYFHQDLNIRRRKPKPEEFESFGNHLARFFIRFMLDKEQKLIRHRDERSEHIFIIGTERDIEVRLVDWGRSSVWPRQRFDEWGMEQFRWFYLELSMNEPLIWKTFVDSLARSVPGESETGTMAGAYLSFVRHQLAPLADTIRRGHAVKFLEFVVRCGRLGLDLGLLNEFAEKHGDLTGNELREAYRRFMK